MTLNLDSIDLGSFGIKEKEDEPGRTPVEDLINVTSGEQQLKSTMNQAVTVNPDQQAELNKLSRESGIPAPAVQANPDQVKKHLDLSKINFDEMSKRTPNTAKFLTDYNNATIAHDDIDVLGKIENVLKDHIGAVVAGGVEFPGMGLSGLGNAYNATGRLLARGVDAVLPESMDKYIWRQSDTPEFVKQINELTDFGLGFNYAGNQLKSVAESVGPEEATFTTDVARGLGQLVGQLATYMASPQAALPLLFGQGADIQAQKQQVTGTEGTTVAADLAVLLGGAVTAGTERVQIDTFLKRLPPEIKNQLAKQIADIGIAGSAEAAQEVIEGVAQNLLELYTTNPDAEIIEGLGYEGAVAGTTGAIAQTIINLIETAVPGKVRTVRADTESQQTQAAVDQATLDNINNAATESKLRDRDAETFKQFVEQNDGDNNTQVFIDGAQAALYLAEKTVEEVQADPALSLLSNQIAESQSLGTDVQIPVADFATHFAGTDHFTVLRDSMTMRDSTVSPFRQEQAQVESEAYITSIMNEVESNASDYVQAQEIFTTVRDQLIDTGAVNGANASIMAEIVPAWATVQSKNRGIPVEQVYREAGLTIEGPQTGEAARLSAEALTQGVVDQEKADNLISEISEFSQIDNGVVTVYHRTTVDAAAEILKTGKMTPRENGLFFSTAKDGQAEGFGDEVIELKIPADQLELDDIFDNEAHLRLPAKINKPNDISKFIKTEQFKQEALTNEQTRRRPEAVDGQTGQQTNVTEAQNRTDDQVLAEYEKAKTGQPVTFLHRSFNDFTSFDDSQLGQNTTTPGANLGHYLAAGDVGNAERYGDISSAHTFTLQNPLVISPDTFESVLGNLTPEEVIERRKALMNMGHDGVLVNDLNWAIVFEGQNIQKVEEDFGDLDQFILNQADQPTNKNARGYYDPANSVIRLTESADLSTFLHEFAHFMYEMELNNKTATGESINNWFKRNAESIALEAGEYEPNTTIIPMHVTQFLDEGTTGDVTRDAGIRRATHEQFARGFETYLMEGEAPSVELRNAFRSFARWLTQIYKSIRGDLKVNLDDEMRQVFARLLATDEQIAAAEARARVEPMFTDAAMAGMTEEEFKKYQERQSKVKDKQTETLRDKLINQLTRQTKAWWKQEKQDIIDEITPDLLNEKFYRARNALKDGQLKLDHATVKEMVGETKTDKLGRKSVRIPTAFKGMTAKGQKGVHPDEAAAFFNYSSGAEMLSDLVSAPPMKEVAESRAQDEMVKRHGDILTDGTIEKEADEAVQNEERGKLILSELKVLSRNTGAAARMLERQQIKAMAEQRIGKLSFRDIHPGKYRKAEITAAAEAARQLQAGNREAAVQAKARQVMNYYLGMEATKAKNETVKIVDRMARYNKKRVREEVQKAGQGYWEQLVKILNRFEFRKSATLGEVEALNTWMKERVEVDGDGLVLTPTVLNESYVTHWKNVPFTDLQGISDSVKNIEHVARYANKLTRIGEEIDYNKLVDKLVTTAAETGTGRFKKSVSAADDLSWVERKGRWAMAQMTKIPFMMSWMDGMERAGIWFNTFSQPFTDAYNDELEMWGEVGRPVVDIIQKRNKEDMKRMNTTFFIPEIVGTAGGTHTGNLKGHEIIAVALNTGNEGNLKKLLLGENWADPNIEEEININNPKLQAVLKHMTKADWEMVQKIWDQINILYPRLAKVYHRTTGIVPPKVEAVPVVTKYGTFAGGYYPIKEDPTRNHRAAEFEERKDAEVGSMFSGSASIQASVSSSATQERTGKVAPLHLTLNVVPNHIQETIHYITHHDAVREVNKLLRDSRVKKSVVEKLGPEEFAQLKPWLNDIAKDGRETPQKMFWDSMLQRLRFGVTLGAMGFKASTGIIQVSGLSNTIAEVGHAPVYQAARTILGSRSTMKSAWDFAVENSKVMAHRTQTMDRDIKNAMKRLEGKQGITAAVQEVSMKHIALIQTYMVDLPSWHAAYIKSMNDYGDETRAYQYADWVVENVQGSGATKDLARIMRGQSETGRMFTMFMTFFSSLWNLERDTVKGAASGRYSTTSIASKLMFLFTVPVLFEMLMRGEFSSDDEDDDETNLQKMLTGVAMYPVQSVPFVRDVANAVTGDFGYNISPLQSVIEQGTQTIPEIVKRGFTDEEITKGQVKGATKFIGAATGIPGTAQAWATGEHLWSVMTEGEDLTLRELLFGPDR